MKFTAPFIVFEGPEGAGKSHQAGILSAWLRQQGWRVVQTREPGGTAAGEAIRDILLQSDDLNLLPETEALLMTAARAQHVREVVRPALEQGKAVVCDRYVDSTYAYQGGGSRVPVKQLRPLQEFATGGLEPTIRLLLDVPVETGLARRHVHADEVNRIDRAPLEFHRRVRDAFLRMAENSPSAWDVIDASMTIDEVSQRIRAVVEARLASAAAGGVST